MGDSSTNEQGRLSDEQLLKAFIQRRDEEAFRQLVVRYGPLVRAVAHGVLHDPSEADDAFQATFLVLAQSARKIRRPTALANWLYGVAYRVSRRIQRRRWRTFDRLEPDMCAANDVSPLEELTRRYDCDAVMREVYRLPASLRHAVLLRYVAGRSRADIAQQMKLSIAAVDGRLKRAHRRLRYHLARQGIAFSAALTWIQLGRADAAVPATLVDQTVRMVTQPNRDGPVEQSMNQDFVRSLMTQEVWVMKACKATQWIGAAMFGVTASVIAGLALAPLGPLARGEQGGRGGITLPAAGAPAEEPTGVHTLLAADTDAEGTPENPFGRSGESSGISDDPFAATPNPPADARTTNSPPSSAKTNPSPIGPFDVSDRSAIERKIEGALETPTELQFTDTPLATITDYLGQLHGIQIVLDRRGLNREGITVDTPVSVDLTGIPLRSALDLMLDHYLLTAVVHNDVLLITSSARAEEELQEVRIYRHHNDWPIAVHSLVDIIQSSISPNDWVDVGGTNFIGALSTSKSGGFVVRAGYDVHYKIQEFLAQLGRLGQADQPSGSQ